MKKLLCLTLTAVLAAALAAPAFADTNVNQDSENKTAQTTVQFNIAPTYTVTIPATVTLNKKTDDVTNAVTYENTFDITAKDVRLNEGKLLRVSLDSDYQLASGTTKLDYTVVAKQGASSEKPVTSQDKECATFATSTADQTVTLHFAAENPTYAGDYADTVTFELKVVDAAQTTNGGNT